MRTHSKILRDDSAQALPFLAMLITLFLGCAGLCLDLGHAYICKAELQASTDAAALAGGAALSVANATTTTVTAAAEAYSSYSSKTVTGANVTSALPSVTFSAKFECLNTLISANVLCTAAGPTGSTGYNAIQVTQTSTISTLFIQALNVFKSKPMTSMTLTATSTASMRGAGAQYNVVLLIDTTASMGQSDSDASCNNTRIHCALSGIQTLLGTLTPCTVAGGKSCTGFDNVSIFTFPNVNANTAQNDYKCNGKTPTISAYSTPVPGATWSAPNGNNPTYQVTSFLDDYSSNNSYGGALSTSSDLVIAAGGNSSCTTGLQTPGGDGTYYAGAIYAALSALNAEQALNPGSQNALIILSDGDASSTKITATSPEVLTLTGLYPSLIDQCHQAITAAKSASSTTTVYTVAYGASSSGCSTDVPSISPCTAMESMATAAADFYSDATASQNNGQCVSSSNSSLSLDQIFSSIGANLEAARLIPNSTT